MGLTITLLVAACVLWRLYLRLRYDPLASAEAAHWSVRYTGAWIWWQHVRDRSAVAVHQAHLRHGPVVRQKLDMPHLVEYHEWPLEGMERSGQSFCA